MKNKLEEHPRELEEHADVQEERRNAMRHRGEERPCELEGHVDVPGKGAVLSSTGGTSAR